MFLQFFRIVRTYPAHIHPDRPRALALYIERVRQTWHQHLLLNRMVFNLAHFNNTLFRSLLDEVSGLVIQDLRDS